jgi:hypothetical protein
MKTAFLIPLFLLSFAAHSQQTPFEKSNGTKTATYFQAIDFYKKLDHSSPKIMVREEGTTDAGYPLHLVLVSDDGIFDPARWHQQNKVVLFINNGIHPGEPDGVDASMMLARDIATNKIKLPGNVALALIPMYNIGGSLNRSGFSRPNQNGPVEYGFRGNSQNLDLNRDFTKSDTREARSFARIFHYLQPDIQIDNHVSDGADYQHTMTLLTTQYDKLGTTLGTWLKETFEPALFKSMAQKGWDMTPYVNFETAVPDIGMLQFYDPPMYSSGYAALFQTIAFMPETHMLKPFMERVKSTYALMQTFIEQAASHAKDLVAIRRKAVAEVAREREFPLRWKPDSSRFSMITLKGYEQAFKTSEATGLQRMYYDHNKPFTKKVKYFNVFRPENIITKPAAYLVPQGWWQVIDLLKLNKVRLFPLQKDSTIDVEVYHIDNYRSNARVFEKHHKNADVSVSVSKQKMKFLKGDFIIPMNQPADRYIVEMLEPTGDDSFFAWNFFDAVLQQKEHYSDYRWEDLAAEVVKGNTGLRKQLDAKKAADTAFANNYAAQLDFIHKHSPYYEPAHLRYPVYRLMQ